MTELRQDPLSGRWTMISESRSQRPIQLAATVAKGETGPCPFCPGNEGETPPAVRIYPESGPWEVRVVPNKYPAVDCEPFESPRYGSPDDVVPPDSMFVGCVNYGRHEVVIESPRHVGDFLEVDSPFAQLAFQAYRDRIVDLTADPRLNYVQVFKNNGASSGASIHHVHSQILAMQRVPPDLRQELEASRRWMARHSECLLCRLLADEQECGARLVSETTHFAAWCPFASRFPFETWIVPRRHASRFETIADSVLAELAEFVREILARLRRAQGEVAYNYVLHTAPLRDANCDHYHWHWEILPRLATLGGYEYATGVYINTVPPEFAARELRARGNDTWGAVNP